LASAAEIAQSCHQIIKRLARRGLVTADEVSYVISYNALLIFEAAVTLAREAPGPGIARAAQMLQLAALFLEDAAAAAPLEKPVCGWPSPRHLLAIALHHRDAWPWLAAGNFIAADPSPSPFPAYPFCLPTYHQILCRLPSFNRNVSACWADDKHTGRPHTRPPYGAVQCVGCTRAIAIHGPRLLPKVAIRP